MASEREKKLRDFAKELWLTNGMGKVAERIEQILAIPETAVPSIGVSYGPISESQKEYIYRGELPPAQTAVPSAKELEYERDYILPCFAWAREYGIDLEKLVQENVGKNCVELLVRTLASRKSETAVLSVEQAQGSEEK